ncbi:beta-galactosidase GalB [Echinicola jeungdonensis]|uniref:Beta-galactosidase GalB n=1 Tax=Echinicola jeungdonensis TaxID=709343 RepID=A0ABV5J502_9BACT|nr:beta-galactosidase GalB [Echinicola jeungdonensis]MDN3669539.1 beta-galactosidase GalB [Echinicola jeungdonensis]
MRKLFSLIGASILFLAFFGCTKPSKEARLIHDFNKDWQFHLGDHPDAIQMDFDASDWRNLRLPHDWSIEGEFSEDHPTRPEGGALPAGIGWYRKTFTVPQEAANKEAANKTTWVEFDGVYRNGEVWINGQHLGKRPNGYSSFHYDLTPYLNYGDSSNIIAVKVDNSQQPNSRWYTGSGIYRNVRLVTTGKVHVAHWGSFVTTPEVSEDVAKVNFQLNLKNDGKEDQPLKVLSKIIDQENKVIASLETDSLIAANAVVLVEQDFSVQSPKLWSPDNPYMYQVQTEVYVNDQLVDNYQTPLGIRYFSFDPEEGFFLNGEYMKILGVCNHHDLGALGAAVNKRAIERRLEILKEMGANAIRTAHNPPSPELLQLCDSMGFIVQDEAFDVWKKKKVDADGHLFWDEWHKRDLEDLILRDRNHPSIMMWSIGNEIREQFDSTGLTITKELVDIVKNLDTTRPVTCALTENIPDKNYIYQSGALDLLGFNYKHKDHKNFPEWYPGEKLIATENMSALATRGQYDLPSDTTMRWPQAHDIPLETGNEDLTVSAYDQVSAYWGSTHEETWKSIKDQDFMSGLFVWTGFDYLGEPIPYPYPARSSYFGIIDLAGFPKDSYYMYQSEWTDKAMLHVFPHWNWQEGQEVDIWAYYNQADEVELFLNGESQGVKKKEGDDLHVMWRIPFEPGTLKVISRKDGKVVLEKEIHTAGEASRIEMTPDRIQLKANGKDMSFITVNILDEEGNLVPEADNVVNFEIVGEGHIAGVDNGYQASLEPFKADYRKAFHGKCLVIVETNENAGKITLKATAEGLEPSEIVLETN